MRIWKWTIPLCGTHTLMLPRGAQLLDVQMQGNDCCLWALCNETAPNVPRTIAVYATGTLIPDEPGKYVGTFQCAGGALVFHVFELPPNT